MTGLGTTETEPVVRATLFLGRVEMTVRAEKAAEVHGVGVDNLGSGRRDGAGRFDEGSHRVARRRIAGSGMVLRLLGSSSSGGGGGLGIVLLFFGLVVEFIVMLDRLCDESSDSIASSFKANTVLDVFPAFLGEVPAQEDVILGASESHQPKELGSVLGSGQGLGDAGKVVRRVAGLIDVTKHATHGIHEDGIGCNTSICGACFWLSGDGVG